MSVYEKTYAVCTADRVVHYVDSVEEVQRVLDMRGRKGAFVDAGYANYEEMDGGTMVTRRTSRRVPLSEIDFEVERAKVQRMIANLRGHKA
jgi:hypothetical protein